jgi:hypothetical protein
MYEKIGFPSSYREGKEEAIFGDVTAKLPNLMKSGQVVVDIGPGCSELPQMLIDVCRERGHELVLLDSAEMLARLPDEPLVRKVAARFPNECVDVLNELRGRVNVLLTYSVLHYVFVEASVFEFVDRIVELLADGGEALIGDIPNVSKRKRFFRSPAGIVFHQEFMRTKDLPDVTFNCVEAGEIDDSVVLSLVARARAAGVDAYVLPQNPELPMANRREDLLLRKP